MTNLCRIMKSSVRIVSIIVCLIAVIFGCNKELCDPLNFTMVAGGCPAQNSSKSYQIPDSDTVTYSIIDGNLNLFVGFNGGCCAPYSKSCEIKDGTIFIKIFATAIDPCNCICFHSYDFVFVGNGANYKYHVTVNDNLVFIGKIKL
jgi:hypothetical protein